MRLSPRAAFAVFDFDLLFVQARFQKAFDTGGEAAVKKELDLFHREVKRRFRQRAKQLHPDVQGNHEKMIALNAAYELLMKLNVQIQRPQPVVQAFYWTGTIYGATSTTSTGSTVSW